MENNERIMRILMSVLLIPAMFLLAWQMASLQDEYVWMGRAWTDFGSEKPCIVIDPGHGGDDPGKVGVTGCYEKDINLEIAGKLKKFLEAEGIEVILTRDGDYGLYSEEDNNKKNADMKNRVKKIEEVKPLLAVSIHQNSFVEEKIQGAQTFYYAKSKEGKCLAEQIQESLIKTLDEENKRVAKANDNYYLLKNTTYPLVIVECGFLSNTKECELLETDYYQEKVAWAVYMGIMRFLNTK